MPEVLEIKDADRHGVLTVDLVRLLDLLGPEGEQLSWRILELEASGDLSRLGRTVQSLEIEVRNSKNGLPITWSDLVILARTLSQVINTKITGYRGELADSQSSGVQDLYNTCEIILEAIDSSLWRIYVRDRKVGDRLRAAFRDVSVHQVP